MASLYTRLHARMTGGPEVPTILHITHAKAGSTWIANLLGELLPGRVAPRGRLVAPDGDVARYQFTPGRIYRAMFMTLGQVLDHNELEAVQRFIIIRDLRDTLISLYFSLKISHPVDAAARTQDHRMQLNALSKEEGLRLLLEEHLPGAAAIQRSWLGRGELLLRYEDVLANPQETLEELFINQLSLPITARALARALRRTGFENVFRRKLGEEDVHSHGRKGLPGDWQNHFTPALRKRCAELYGQLLIDAGYEKDKTWAS